MTTTTITALEGVLRSVSIDTPIPEGSEATILRYPLEVPRLYLTETLRAIVPEHAANATGSIQTATNIDQGDLTVILPKLKHGCDAELWGLELMQKFPKSPLFVLPIPDGAQLRFFLNPATLAQWLLPFIIDRGSSYGCPLQQKTDAEGTSVPKVLIESSSPNIASEFHGKHLRSTILGAQIANIYKAFGWDVTKLNYLGDWGKPIGLLGAGFEKFGFQELFDADPVGHLHDVYQQTLDRFKPEQIESKKARDDHGDAAAAEVESKGLFAERNEFFKRMQAGDEKALEFAKRFRSLSIEQYTDLYARLGVSFDDYSGESQIAPETMNEVMQIMEDKQLLEESGGAKAINLKAHGGKHGTAIIKDRDGSNTYLLRDIAAVIERHRKYEFDRMIYVVAGDHRTHFLKLFKILELMDLKDLADKLQHVSFSENSQIPKSGEHEQTLGHFLDQCETGTKKVLGDGAESTPGFQQIPVTDLCRAALFVHVASIRSSSNLVFDTDKLASFESGSGPDLLAWYRSLTMIQEVPIDLGSLSIAEAEASLEHHVAEKENEKQSNASALWESEAPLNLLRMLARFPEVMDSAFNSADLANVIAYLPGIIACLEVCIPDRNAIAPENETHRMLFQATSIVLGNALSTLGLLGRDGNRDSGVYF